MDNDVWIPAAVRPEHRALLPDGIVVHELPAEGARGRKLGHGDLLVADYRQDRVVEAIQALDGLRVVQAMSAGVDSLLPFIPEGVTLCDAAGVHDVSVSEWTVMAILSQFHNLATLVDAQRQGRWSRTGGFSGGDDLEGKTVLILGYGSIGRAVESRLGPFGVDVVRVARHPREGVRPLADLPRLLPQADIVVVLLPLTPETRGMVGAEFIQTMRPGALLVNPARGPIVDTEALTAALQAGHIKAALDVTDPEPLPEGHPLWTAPGVLITPHTAGAVRRVLDRAWQLVAEQVRRHRDGEPLRNVVVDGY